jgi:hypothetical protein
VLKATDEAKMIQAIRAVGAGESDLEVSLLTVNQLKELWWT